MRTHPALLILCSVSVTSGAALADDLTVLDGKNDSFSPEGSTAAWRRLLASHCVERRRASGDMRRNPRGEFHDRRERTRLFTPRHDLGC